MSKKNQHPTAANGSIESPEPIAIVGMACLFPKAAGVKNYWRLIRGLEDAVTDVPDTHWPIDSYFDDDPKAPDMTYCKRGSFLSAVDFDPTEFGIPPSILEATDTAQLLGLVTAKAALEDSGYYDREGHDHSRTSVIMGVTGTLELVIPLGARLGHPHWRKALKDAGVEDSVANDVVKRISNSYVGWQENSFPGLLGNVVAGRIANRLDLHGTNCVVDAACASSLSALHLGAMELATGKSDMVVTGGIDSLNDIFMFMCFSKTQALSATGNARPFDRDADGTVIGEGSGVLVMKRLADAERDGDTIHAVLKGVGTSSDGRSQSIYAPRASGQARALRDAYRRARVQPSQVGLVEAHGTGTKVGDATEFEALKTVYSESINQNADVAPWCAVGSVKSQIGHTKAAAGAASLVKTVIALRNRVLPGTIKVESPNPKMTDSDSPFYINTETRPWLTKDNQLRRAAVSSFGFGGSNFHAVLEEYPQTDRKPAWDGSVEILALSANVKTTLQKEVETWRSRLSQGVKPAEFAREASESRRAFDSKHVHRLVVVIDDLSKAKDLLADVTTKLQSPDSPSSWNRSTAYYASGSKPGKLAFVFPGQGSQYIGMASDMACVFPESLDAFAIQPDGMDQPIGSFICPPPSFDAAKRDADNDSLRQTDVAQPALAAAELAYLRILENFAVRADTVAGHSFGELTALRAAGRINDDTLCQLARQRGKLMREGDGDRGTMLAVHASAGAVAELIEDQKIDVVLANCNGPKQVVLSGTKEGIQKAANACRQREWRVSKIDVAAAFHSPLMRDAAIKFRKVLDGIEFHNGSIEVYANRSGGVYPDAKTAALDVLAGQLDATVRFEEQIEAMYASGVRTFLEVGPKRVLCGLIKSILGDRNHKTIAVDDSSSRKDGVFDLACAIGQLAAQGHAVELSGWEDEPQETRKAKMAIPIHGINYRAPYKELPPAAPKSKTQPMHSNPVPPRETVQPTKPVASTEVSIGRPVHTESKAMPQNHSHVPEHVPASTPASQSNAPSSQHLSDVFKVVEEGIRAMQSLQQQTATAHQRFLEGQEEAQRSFQKVIQSQQQMFAQMGGAAGMASQTAQQAPAMPAPVVARPVQAPVQAPTAPTPATATKVKPVAEPVAESLRAVAEHKQVEQKQPAEQVEAKSAVSSANDQVATTLLEVVSELTGYPTEMIDVSMDLEADLGIDSIKRVEILASVQERMPNLSTIDSSELGSLRTLQDILSEMGVADSNASPASTTQAVPAESAPTESVASSPIRGVLLDVVAELTGYPVEMLDVTMDLEADLGIDSIKRVEILAAVQERQPELAAIDSSELGSLRTLEDILKQFGAEASASDAVQSEDAPAHATGESSGEVQSVLLDVVSQLTGYPVEMLDMDMDLEADLGIDSIKRVEILAGVQEREPSLKSVDSSELGSMRTLRDIIAQLDGGSSTVVSSPVATESTTANAESIVESAEVARQVLVARVLEPAVGQPICIAAGYELWIIDDGTSLSKSIAEKLTAQGIAARVVGSSDPVDGEACAPVGGVIHVVGPASYNESGLMTSVTEQVKDAFRMTKELAADIQAAAKEGGALLATVSRMDGSFGLTESQFDPNQGGLAGLAKTCAIEWPDVHCRSLDVDASMGQGADVAERIICELSAPGPIEVGVTSDGRFGLDLEERKVAVKPMPLVKGDVVVVSGGARGVTGETAIALAEASKAHFVLLGRSSEPFAEPAWAAGLTDEGLLKRAVLQNEFASSKKPSPSELEAAYRRHAANREINATLDRIQSVGGTAEYRSVNVCDRDQVAGVISDVRKSRGPIRGLIHGAGVIEDAFIADKDPTAFDRVFDTKVQGFDALLNAAGDDPRVIVLFSSVSGRFGRQGQVDYAMANEVLNKIASVESRRRNDCKVVAMNWGPWDGGMVTPTLRKQFEREGVFLIPLQAGAKCLVDEICCDDTSATEVLIGGGFDQAQAPSNQSASASGGRQATMTAFERSVSVADHPFLASHQLSGKAVLPMAMIVEWLGHAALHTNPGLKLKGLSELRVFKGVIVGDDAVDVEVMVSRPESDQSNLLVTTELRSRQANGQSVLHARATARLGDQRDDAPSIKEPSGLTTESFKGTAQSIYSDVLFHDADFHAIETVEGIGSDGMVASIKAAPKPAAWIDSPLRGTWLTDPLVIDGVLQLGIVWQHAKTGHLSLPGYVANFEQYADRFPEGAVRCALHVRESSSSRVVADAYLSDKSGKLIAKLDGCTWTTNAQLADAFGKVSSRSA